MTVNENCSVSTSALAPTAPFKLCDYNLAPHSLKFHLLKVDSAHLKWYVFTTVLESCVKPPKRGR